MKLFPSICTLIILTGAFTTYSDIVHPIKADAQFCTNCGAPKGSAGGGSR